MPFSPTPHNHHLKLSCDLYTSLRGSVSPTRTSTPREKGKDFVLFILLPPHIEPCQVHGKLRKKKTINPLSVYLDSSWSSEAAWKQDSPTHFSSTHSRMFHERSRGCSWLHSALLPPPSARLAVGSSRASADGIFLPGALLQSVFNSKLLPYKN